MLLTDDISRVDHADLQSGQQIGDGGSRKICAAMYAASAANAVIKKFNSLKETQKQDILNFLRSL